MTPPVPDALTLLIGGQRYSGWTEMRLTRRIDRMATDFDVSVSERWDGQATMWQIRKFDACQVLIGSDPVMTGYVDAYRPRIDGTNHAVRITGRSKTAQLIDCMPDLPSGQYKGYALAAVARAIAAPFGVTVVDQVGDPDPLSDTMLDRCESGFQFLERLARLARVLLTDDEQGRLVLARTGSVRAHDTLALPGNVLLAEAELDGHRQFSRYVIKGQHALSASSPTVQTAQQAVASDPSVPIFRQHVSYAESMLSAEQMQERVRWQAVYACGRSTQARVTVRGWRQSNGDLWRVNQLVATDIAYLEIGQDMLIAGVQFSIGPEGHRTMLTLGPPEAYTPDPGEVRLRKNKQRRGGGGGVNWSGAGGIQ